MSLGSIFCNPRYNLLSSKLLVYTPIRLCMMSTQIPPETRLAILHQAAPPPPVNGIHKPMKPGGSSCILFFYPRAPTDNRPGYQDSGADIAFCLSQSHSSNIKVITPLLSPKPEQAEGWTFPDTESGILTALNQGATHIWANTILFSTHPLQISPLLDPCLDNVKVVGQPPNLVEMGDDKEFVNNLLRAHDGFTLPKSWSLSLGEEVEIEKLGLTYPVVAKPIRGRGSFGVKVCHSEAELQSHLRSLLADSSRVMIEEFLSGQEATLTVMPPSHSKPDYYALPPVKRFNHQNDIAPWNGIVAVSANSCVVTNEEMERDARWGEVMRECERAAQLLGVVGVIRIDVPVSELSTLNKPMEVREIGLITRNTEHDRSRTSRKR